jgi:amino acid transporter
MSQSMPGEDYQADVFDVSDDNESQSQAHELDPFSLVFGLIFATIGLAFLVKAINIGTIGPGWQWALGLSTIGMLLVAAGVHRHSRR